MTAPAGRRDSVACREGQCVIFNMSAGLAADGDGGRNRRHNAVYRNSGAVVSSILQHRGSSSSSGGRHTIHDIRPLIHTSGTRRRMSVLLNVRCLCSSRSNHGPLYTSRHHSIRGRSQPGRSELAVPLHRRRNITIIIVYSRIKFKKKIKQKLSKISPSPTCVLYLTLTPILT